MAKNGGKIFKYPTLYNSLHIFRRFREVLSHPFHFDQVKEWVNDFDQLGDQLLDIWTENHTNQPLEVVSWLARFTVDVLGRTVFSTNFHAMQGKTDKISQYLGEIVRRVANPTELIAGAVSLNNAMQMDGL